MDKSSIIKEKTTPIHLRNVPPPPEKFNHAAFIAYLAQWLKSDTYLELGVRSSPVIPKMLSLARTCIGVDLNPYNLTAVNLEFYQMSTDDFFQNIMKPNPRTIDMVFIDANHSHEASLRDFDNVFPYVQEDGFILLHDTYPCSEKYTSPGFCHTAYQTAWYIRTKYNDKCEILTLPFQPGLSMVRKCSKQLAWMKE